MGTITRSFANNLTTNGILKADAFNNASLNNVTALNVAIATGNMVLISSQTASASASISFTTGIDSTYKEYQFWFINIHPATDDVNFSFQVNAVGETGFNETITSTYFIANHTEADATDFSYSTSRDQAQGTSYQVISEGDGSDADQALSGTLTLFNPASTTYVKHFISTINGIRHNNSSNNQFCAGYINTTNGIDEIDFKFDSGNIDDGTILMFGIK